MLPLPIKQLDPDLPLPKAAKHGDAGVDLLAAEAVSLAAGGGRQMVSTGIAVAIPDGFAGFLQPRSGLAAKHGVSIVNTPGLIDSGYRGEIKVVLVNTDPENVFKAERGDRIAQLVVQKVEQVEFLPVEELPEQEHENARGATGFGQSGLN